MVFRRSEFALSKIAFSVYRFNFLEFIFLDHFKMRFQRAKMAFYMH